MGSRIRTEGRRPYARSGLLYGSSELWLSMIGGSCGKLWEAFAYVVQWFSAGRLDSCCDSRAEVELNSVGKRFSKYRGM